MESYGKTITEYEIHELLGTGGFASVYRGRCKLTGREVAIKMIDVEKTKKSRMVNRVKQEVKIHYQLEHPSIIQLITFFQDDDYVYLVLELCHNGEIKKYLEKTGISPTEPEVANIMRQVVQGIQYLQKHKIAHRDLTLANLLLTKDLNIKIADFGLATQFAHENEKHMTMCGTPNYISPEIATRSAYGLETDAWGLGVMLYILLVGRAPFDTSGGVQSTMAKVVMSEVKIPSSLSREAQHLIYNLLRKNPNDRLKLSKILDHPFMANGSRRLSGYDSGVFFSQRFSTCSSIPSSTNPANSLHKTSQPPAFPKGQPVRAQSFERASNNRPVVGAHARCSSTNEVFNAPPPRGVFNANRAADHYSQTPRTHHSVARDSPYPTSATERENFNDVPINHHMDHMEQPNSYHSRHSGYRSRSAEPECGHAWRDCAQCSHIASCSCQRQSSHIRQPCTSAMAHGHDFQHEARLSAHTSQNVSVGKSASRHSAHKSRSRRNGDGESFNPVSVSHSQSSETKPTEPLNSSRLHPLRKTTRMAIMHILENKEVCLEFTKSRNGIVEVTEVYRISADGLRIITYRPNDGRGAPVGPCPPSIPSEGTKFMFIHNYENLPEECWKKYRIASKFVDLLKSTTRKIRYYSSAAKCELMENAPDPDFEAIFYEGHKITKSKSKITFMEKHGSPLEFDMTDSQRLPLHPSGQLIWEHFLICYQHCRNIEESLEFVAQASGTECGCFPIIVGQRPQQFARAQQQQQQRSPSQTSNKENVSPQSEINLSRPSMRGSDTSTANTTTGKPRKQKIVKAITIDGIGSVTQLTNEDIDINYFDGTRLLVHVNTETFTSVSSCGKVQRHSQKGVKDPSIRAKLNEMPRIVQALRLS